MSRTVKLPDAVYVALTEVAVAFGTSPADWIAAHLPPSSSVNDMNSQSKDDWLDHDFLQNYSHEADESVTLEAVRTAMAKIPGRLADDIRAERDER